MWTMIFGDPETPSPCHQPVGGGVGIIADNGFCICGGNSSQLHKAKATAVKNVKRTNQLNFMGRRYNARWPSRFNLNDWATLSVCSHGPVGRPAEEFWNTTVTGHRHVATG